MKDFRPRAPACSAVLPLVCRLKPFFASGDPGCQGARFERDGPDITLPSAGRPLKLTDLPSTSSSWVGGNPPVKRGPSFGARPSRIFRPASDIEARRIMRCTRFRSLRLPVSEKSDFVSTRCSMATGGCCTGAMEAFLCLGAPFCLSWATFMCGVSSLPGEARGPRRGQPRAQHGAPRASA